jgi:cell fate (sporulation/competence/biofilm development) regulator YlbF (YheA/YmcA/DUF963 family)
MNTQPSVSYIPPILPDARDQTAVQAARALGKVLSDIPEYQAFLKALQEVNNNAEVQRLSVKIREHNIALQWGKGDLLEHQAATETLQAELESLPSLRAYRQAEEAITRLFHAVDEVISQAAGVPFAANAKRSGCGCGG